jgi:Flp pilus assembly protein TadG
MSRAERRERGQSLVEFALILPLFVLLLVGLFDVGRAVFAYNTVNNAAREAGRLAIVDQYEDHIKDEAVAAAAGVDIARDDVVVTYRRPDGTACTAVGTDAVVGCVAHVRVTHRYTAALPLVGNLIGPLQITGESRFPVSINCATSTCPLGS